MNFRASNSSPGHCPDADSFGHDVLTAGDLANRARSVSPDAKCAAIAEAFSDDRDLFSIVVLDLNDIPIGLLRRLEVLAKFSTRYFLDIHKNKPCTMLMDPHLLSFDSTTPVSTMADAVAGIPEAHLLDGFIVTKNGQYLGSGRVSQLLRAVNQLQVATARNSNPLTLLPGNTLIQVQMDLALESGKTFCVAYFDLDHFKPFNDVYGYKLGDELILTCAQTIKRHLRGEPDFLGHVGGDDFIAILYSADWEHRIQQILKAFDLSVQQFFLAEHIAAGGYIVPNRMGKDEFHPITSLSIGVVLAEPGAYRQHVAVATAAAEAKKEAK